MLDLFNAFATDLTTEQAGVLTELPGAGDTKFRVARSGNKSYSRQVQKAWKMNRAVLESKGDAAEAKNDEILIDVLARTVLLGWEGTVKYKGKDLEYSLENAKMLLAHKEFRLVVSKVSEDMETFKTVKEAEDEGN